MSVSYIPKWGWSHGRADRIDRYTTEYVYQVPARRRRAFGERLCQRGNFQFYEPLPVGAFLSFFERQSMCGQVG